MSTDHIVQQLHDKATRGIALSAEEQARLEAWYAEQDRKEHESLGATSVTQRLATLHTHIETALGQLQATTERIQELTAQNEEVRREIVVLQRQLVQASTREPA